MRVPLLTILWIIGSGFTLAATGSHAKSLPYTGVNLAGAEFGKVLGRPNFDYVYPRQADVDYFRDRGMNIIRLPFKWERLQRSLGGEFDRGELTLLKGAVEMITRKGLSVIINPHNYARYNGQIVGSPEVPLAQFSDLWRRLALEFKSNERAIFGLMNEPNKMPTEQWRDASNAAIMATREAGARNLILVPGNAWSGGHSWGSSSYGTPNAVVMDKITDPSNNFAFEIHQYLDSDYSGTHPTCKAADDAKRTLVGVTQWLRERGKKGLIGEFGAGPDENCLNGLETMLSFLEANSDVWLGWTYWAAGHWWGKYPLSVQPSAEGDRPQMKVLIRHSQKPH